MKNNISAFDDIDQKKHLARKIKKKFLEHTNYQRVFLPNILDLMSIKEKSAFDNNGRHKLEWIKNMINHNKIAKEKLLYIQYEQHARNELLNSNPSGYWDYFMYEVIDLLCCSLRLWIPKLIRY